MLLDNSKKIVIKLGSSTVVDKRGKFKKNWVTTLIKDIKKYGKGKHFVIVSSGAIALGQKYLNIKKKKIKLEMSQAIAAVGQIHLAGEFQNLFDKFKIKSGQILISPDDTEQRRRALNVRNTFDKYTHLSKHYAFNSASTDLPVSWDKGYDEMSLIEIPSIFYGSSIKKGSVCLKFYLFCLKVF